jgi:hypothetical protein
VTARPGDRPLIFATVNHDRTVRQVIEVFATRDESLYKKDGKLVEVVTRPKPNSNYPPYPEIVTLPVPKIQTLITRHVQLKERTEEKPDGKPCHPPQWLASEVHADNHFVGIRPLAGVSLASGASVAKPRPRSAAAEGGALPAVCGNAVAGGQTRK